MLYPASGLDNLLIGGQWNQVVGIAFKAAFSSPLAAVRFYEINKNPVGKAGYMGGTGGMISYSLCSDNNGIPGNRIALGVLSSDAQYIEWLNNGGFPLVVFPTFPSLADGTWYHFVMTNVDPQPTVNFVSADFLIGKTNANPDPNTFVEYRPAGNPWTTYSSLIASPFGVFYADGNLQGNGGYQIAADGSTQCGAEYGFGKLC